MKSSFIKSLDYNFVLFAAILFLLVGCNNHVEKNLQPEIDSIVARCVPDQRIDICKITAKPGSDRKLVLVGETTNKTAKQEVIKTLNNQGIEFIDSILILPDTLKNKKYMGLVTISVINLRKQPSHQSELVSQSILGSPLIILKNENSWLLIQTPDHYIAWTEASSVKLMNRAEIAAWKKADRVIYIKNSGWIYSNQSTDSGVVGDLVAGSIMEKTDESKGFINITLPDQRKGYVNKNDIMEFDLFRNKIIPDGEGVIRMASSLLGIPYLWGGSSTKGVDCSGFVQTVFFMNGLILMRDASLQAIHGETVDFSGGFSLLKKGDLLFFGSKVNSKPRVTHVAIYKGNNEYINSSGRVLINSLDSASTVFVRYRLNSLLAVRRIIGVENDPGIVPISKHLWY
jgi:gamma-D-glutamyl-L-lysine dipeptidyl-peptidase